MTQEENDHKTPQHLRELFRDFEAEPPRQSWNMIRTRLAQDIQDDKAPSTLSHMLGWFRPVNRLYPALTIVGLILIALFIWLGINPSHHIKGNAFVGEDKLDRGTAYLFRVQDKITPFDSVRFWQQKELDSTGYFAFQKVPSGNYLLRIHVHPLSPYFFQYKHGYYRDQLHWNNATLIHTDHLQESYPVRVPKISLK